MGLFRSILFQRPQLCAKAGCGGKVLVSIALARCDRLSLALVDGLTVSKGWRGGAVTTSFRAMAETG